MVYEGIAESRLFDMSHSTLVKKFDLGWGNSKQDHLVLTRRTGELHTLQDSLIVPSIPPFCLNLHMRFDKLSSMRKHLISELKVDYAG